MIMPLSLLLQSIINTRNRSTLDYIIIRIKRGARKKKKKKVKNQNSTTFVFLPQLSRDSPIKKKHTTKL